MAVQQKLLIDAYSACLSEMKNMGVRLTALTDPADVLEVANIMRDPQMTPEMSPLTNSSAQGHCFWLVAEKGNEIVNLGGARFDDIGESSVSQHWLWNAQRNHASPWNTEPLWVNKRVDGRLGGRLVYFGHLRSSSGKGSLARTAYFIRAGQMLAATKWDPDFIYAFVKRKECDNGAQSRYGFATRLPAVQRWQNEPKGRSNTESCLLNSKSDILFLAEEIIADGDEAIAKRLLDYEQGMREVEVLRKQIHLSETGTKRHQNG